VGRPIGVAAVLGLVTGAVVGLLNGLPVAYGGLPPMIVTLGSGIVAAGLALGISDGRPSFGFPDSFLELGTGRILGLPIQLVARLVS